ncbi:MULTISPECIES: FAD-binding oxidoreductase [Brucella]|jgi:FAD/FMN-containing dehydrogenase|uniref:FAD-binding oxidoreductase n=1 Tax=Brucella anthropi TaxID=529 RepID=A0A011ULQ0_BRUAN|nr:MULTISPECIES: FAD-binding oxidoreductase [Brucella/Ochrobactrum group]QOD64044.1 FAD-binding oxidoreductase [Ochrobactrum sp. MT180101]QTN02090.1 FAD-binding protein [Ochrobactrum sp. EEELCW01]EXL07141.1 2-hydroxyacid dehydrogenase [Brucella anthropi]KAB2740790.1 FAD-binding oxidoreductase [Brucella anthropi]KAB2750735.1 FAD-binding oxidoreductase [Brucella anthropi]
MLDTALIERFSAIVGEKNALTAPEDLAAYLVEQRDLYHGRTPLVLRPGSTEEVAAIMKLASETKTPVVPQGGNTGLVGGQQPDESGAAIILSLGRMNRIRNLDTVGNLVTLEAGVILKNLQEAAEKAGRLFPLSLGAEGSCQIGGNLGSNAGGTAVLAYGNMRELCLGLEVVLPTGEILNDLRYVKKDNTGYDLKDLFIGSEGTLGVITAAVLKIFPQPKGKGVAYAGLRNPEDVLRLFQLATEHAGPSLTGFELMPRVGVEFTVRHVDGVRDPLESPHDWYVLIDISSTRSEEDARTTLETILTEAFESDIIQDAAIGESVAQAQSFWKMREEMSWAQKPEGGSIKHDISVPVASIPAFIHEANAATLEMIPGARIVCFGHIGDGNLHYNVSQPVGADKEAFLARWHELNHRIHTIVASYTGSISAEHGIGQLKREELAFFKQDVALDLMRRIKSAFDPAGIMNPGKVL